MAAPPRPLFLLTNDDGYFAPGLQALAAAARRHAKVVIVAPDREQSASGHSLTMNAPLRVNEVAPGVHALSGTPTDCVAMAIQQLLGRKPDLILSGINAGSNLGNDVTYSGTVAAAMEGTLNRIPAIAFSQRLDRRPGGKSPDYAAAAKLALQIALKLLKEPLPSGTFLNVNFPVEPTGEVAAARLGSRHYDESVTRRHDPLGKPYFWIGGAAPVWREESGTDYEAIRRGAVAITPLHLDLTHYEQLPRLAPLAKALSAKKARR